MKTEENIPQKDQHIRQKLTDFCPDTAWTPAKTWEEIAKKIDNEEEKRVIYFYPKTAFRVAAVFLLLLSIGGVIWRQTINQKPSNAQQSHLNTSDEQPNAQKLHSKEEDKLSNTKTLIEERKSEMELKQYEPTHLTKAQKTQKIVKISKKDKNSPSLQETEIRSPSTDLVAAPEVPTITENEPLALIQNLNNNATKQTPQIVLQVAESAKVNKFGIRLGKRKNNTTQEIADTNENKKNKKSSIRIQAQPNKSSIQTQETNTVVALLKVKLK